MAAPERLRTWLFWRREKGGWTAVEITAGQQPRLENPATGDQLREVLVVVAPSVRGARDMARAATPDYRVFHARPPEPHDYSGAPPPPR